VSEMEKLSEILWAVAATTVIVAIVFALDRCNERNIAARAACVEAGHDPISCREMLRTQP